MKTLKLFAVLVLAVAASFGLVAPGYGQPVSVVAPTTQEQVVSSPPKAVAPTPPDEVLVARSPWTGNSTRIADGSWSAGLELTFYRRNGKELRASLHVSGGAQKTYGANPDGEVRFLEVKGNRISFTSQSGTEHTALLTNEGELSGTTIPPNSRVPVVKYTLRPK